MHEFRVIYWDSFIYAFKCCKKLIRKFSQKELKGNNCSIRHRIRRGLRRGCNFSKKLKNHFKAFDLTFFYFNNVFIEYQHAFWKATKVTIYMYFIFHKKFFQKLFYIYLKYYLLNILMKFQHYNMWTIQPTSSSTWWIYEMLERILLNSTTIVLL